MTIAATRQSNYPANSLERYARAAHAAGCPRDQVSRFVRGGYVAQPKQLLFHAAARACDVTGGPEEVGFGGSRGPGKSHAMLAQIGLDDCQRQPGLKALILRKVGKAVRESVKDMIPRIFHQTPHSFNRSDGTIEFANGSRIILGHYKDEKDVDNYLGLEYDVIGIEEATTLSAKKDEIIGTCLRTSKPNWRPRKYSTTNPGGIGHQWYKKRYIDPFRQHQEQRTRFIPATSQDNRFLNPEYRATLDRLIGWMLKAWRDGDWDIAAGQYFTNWNESLHVIDAPLIGVDWRVWLSFDYGYNHWTVAHLLAQTNDGVIIVVDEHAARRTQIVTHIELMDAMLGRNGIKKERLSSMVAGHDIFSQDKNGKTIADDYAAAGYRFTPAAVSRINGASELTTRLGEPPKLRPTLKIVRRCTRLIDCLPNLQHDPDRPEDVLKVDCDPDTGDGGDDAYDSCRYGVMTQAISAGWTPDALKALGSRRSV